LLLGKNWQREAADHQQDDSEYQAFHVTPLSIDQKLALLAVSNPAKKLALN